jgi:hypothetical protein
MVIAAVVAFYKGWKIHTGPYAVLAVCLGVAALALAAWHFTRKTPAPRP